MKKNILTISIGFIITINAYAQIGIQTENPAANILVHIDAESNNASGGSNLYIDDVVIDKNGNVGIGTIVPTAKLHIVTGGTSVSPNPQLIIDDGYRAVNRVLTSDANGSARWADYVPGYKAGTVGAGIMYATTSGSWAKTNMSVSLDPGQWLIFYSISMITNTVSVSDPNYRIWIQVGMGDNTDAATLDAISRNRFSNSGFIGKRAFINGWIAVDNTTSAAKAYSVYVGGVQRALAGLNLLNVGEVSDGYSNIYAFRISMQ